MYQKIKAENLQTTIKAVESTATDDTEFVMDLEDDHWIVYSKDQANVIFTSVLVPHTAMAEYDRNNYDTIGVDGDKIKGFIQSKNDWIELEMMERTLNIDDGDVSADLATIDPEAVSGRVNKAPDIEHEVIVEGGFDRIISFVERAQSVLNTGNYYIGGREDGVYLYTSGDNGKMSQRIPWDEFDGYELDWSVDNDPPGNGHQPAEDHAFDCIMGIEYTKSLNTLDGNVKMALGNHMPLRLLYYDLDDDNNETGIKVNYYQTPRINDSGMSKIPDKIIEEERN